MPLGVQGELIKGALSRAARRWKALASGGAPLYESRPHQQQLLDGMEPD